MPLNFIRFGIRAFLKTICERINIKLIKILMKNYKYNGKIDLLKIEAQNVIYKKIYIHNIIIDIYNLNLRIGLSAKLIELDDSLAKVILRLSNRDLTDTFINNKWREIKNSIELFVNKSDIRRIDIKNNSLYFINSEISNDYLDSFSFELENKHLFLKNNISNKRLQIPLDPNIIINNLVINENNIDINLSSKLIFNT